MNRINEISFNSSLLREMRAIAFVTKLIDKEISCDLDLKRIYVHSISDDETMRMLSAVSKLNADWEALTALRDRGRECASEWLETNYGHIGVCSTVDIESRYL
jgi:NTE family protein